MRNFNHFVHFLPIIGKLAKSAQVAPYCAPIKDPIQYHIQSTYPKWDLLWRWPSFWCKPECYSQAERWSCFRRHPSDSFVNPSHRRGNCCPLQQGRKSMKFMLFLNFDYLLSIFMSFFMFESSSEIPRRMLCMSPTLCWKSKRCIILQYLQSTNTIDKSIRVKNLWNQYINDEYFHENLWN